MSTLAFPRGELGEKKYLQSIATLARILGWEVHHEFDSRYSSAGWPDLELVRPPRHIRAEVKVHGGHLEPEQERILGLLRQCPGTETYVWWEQDWPDIQRILSRGYEP